MGSALEPGRLEPYERPLRRAPKRPDEARASAASEAGLRWLARHQSSNGGWSAEHFDAQCSGSARGVRGLSEFDRALTALAVLAFLERGITPSNRATYVDPVNGKTMRFGEVVRRGLAHLIEQPAPNEAPCGERGLYNDAISAYALASAFGITGAVSYRMPAQQSLFRLIQARR